MGSYIRQWTCAYPWYHCRCGDDCACRTIDSANLTMLTYYCDRNVFAKPCRTNIHLIYANMHKSRFILIIKMRALCATDCYAGESVAFYTSSLIINSNPELGWNRWDERALFPVAGTQCESQRENTFSHFLIQCWFVGLLLFLSASLYSYSAPLGAQARWKFNKLS